MFQDRNYNTTSKGKVRGFGCVTMVRVYVIISFIFLLIIKEAYCYSHWGTGDANPVMVRIPSFPVQYLINDTTLPTSHLKEVTALVIIGVILQGRDLILFCILMRAAKEWRNLCSQPHQKILAFFATRVTIPSILTQHK